jgi:hypothetical protein
MESTYNMYPDLISRSISEDKNDQRHAQIRLDYPSSRSMQTKLQNAECRITNK